MAAPAQAGPFWTVLEYLDLERHSAVKHEYHGGQVYAMAGGTQAHSLIAGNAYAALRSAVRGTGCRALTSDMKIRQSSEDYVYADAVVTCDPRDDVPSREWIEYPVLVVEVLSRTTERHDRGDKFDGYKQMGTLREYVLVNSRRRAVVVWRRDDAGEWRATEYGPDEAVTLTSVPASLPQDLLYEDSGL